MKTLEQIQEENRKFIIMANNPTAKTYEEALEMELSFSVGCEFEYRIHKGTSPIKTISMGNVSNNLNLHPSYVAEDDPKDSNDDWITPINIGSEKDLTFGINKKWITKIIGKPLTLSRVLNAFGKKRFNLLTIILDSWDDLSKETLEEQSEKTQREINKLIKL